MIGCLWFAIAVI